jgi:hypothetical protein
VPTHPLTEADVWRRIGGRAALTQLVNPGGTTTWDAATVEIGMQDAWNFVVAAVGVQVELAGQTNDQIRENFPHLVTLASQKALRFIWVSGSGGQAVPDGIKELDTLADQQLQMLAERRRKHGAVGFSPSPAQAIENIDLNKFGGRMTLTGFRDGGFI